MFCMRCRSHTSHGHDGLMRDGTILNDETVAVLVKQALVQAEAGCDIRAVRHDGRPVGAIRSALDAAGYLDVQIMAYRRNTPPRSTRSAMRSVRRRR